MKKLLLIALVVLSVWCSGCNAQTREVTETVKPCDVKVPRELRESSFVVVYRFNVANKGATQNIRKVKNDYLPDEPFVSCIADWKLPAVGGEATATFFRKPAAGGWTELVVSAKGFDRTYRYDNR